jgi:hypothetical protein
MTVHGDLEGVITGELDDVERALKKGDVDKAKRDLAHAISKLRDIARTVNKLEVGALRR